MCSCNHAYCPIRDIFAYIKTEYVDGKMILVNGLPNYQRILLNHIAYMKKEALFEKQQIQKAAQKLRKEKWLLSKAT